MKLPVALASSGFHNDNILMAQTFPREMINVFSHIVTVNAQEASVNRSRDLSSNQHQLLHGDSSGILMARPLNPRGKWENENQIFAQNHAFAIAELVEEGSNVYQPPAVTISIPGTRSCGRKAITSRVRRARITEGIKALQDILPNSVEGSSRAAVLDDIIDYVKYLQFQIKVLSQNRLGGEASGDPFVHLKGYGHYLIHQQMRSEPLEELIGQLMEVNIAGTTQLLESKGLSLMPISLAQGLV